MSGKIKILIFIFVGCFENVALATLPMGTGYVRMDTVSTSGSGYWTKSDFNPFAGGGKTQDYGVRLSNSYGITSKVQLDTSILYRHFEYKNGSPEMMGTVQPGMANEGIAEVKFSVLRELFNNRSNFALNGYLGFRSPGERKADPNGNFNSGHLLGLSDEIPKYDLGMSLFWQPGSFALNMDFNYIYRPGKHGDQYAININIPYLTEWGLAFGPMATYFKTLDGTDIMSSEFMASGMNFSLIKEDFINVGVFIQKQFHPEFGMDAFYLQKVAGQNTDKTESMGIGLTYSYDIFSKGRKNRPVPSSSN